MACKKCSITGSADEPLAACDKCSSALCKSCACLSTTEMRAVGMKNRSLIYHCIDCRGAQDYATIQPVSKDTLLDDMRREFVLLFESLTAKLTDEVSQQMNSVRDELAILRLTNTDLLRLCFPDGQRATIASHLPSPSVAQAVSDVGNSGGLTGRGAGVSGTAAQSTPSARMSSRGHPKSTVGISAQTASGNRSNPPKSTDKVRVPVPAEPPAGQSAFSSAGNSDRRTPYSSVLGSRSDSGARIAAANLQKKTSILVGRLDLKVTTDDLKDYLKSTFGETECFLVEEQKVRSGEYRSFRVEARLDILGELLCHSNWPEGVLVKKFRFFRSRAPVSQ